MYIPFVRLEQEMKRKIETFKSIIIITYATYKFPFDNTIHITGSPYHLLRKDLSPIFPTQSADTLTIDGKARYIMSDKLFFDAIWYGYAD